MAKRRRSTALALARRCDAAHMGVMMRYLRKAPGSVSRLNCGLCRDRGIVRTSMTRPMPCAFRSRAKSSIDRVECPMVKMTTAATVSHACD